MKFTLKKSQKGFTLVELGIVVAIAAIIIGIGLVVVPSILASTRANAEISELPTVATKITRAYANQPDFSAITTAGVIDLGAYQAASVNRTAGTITNRWGGNVTVASDTLVNADDVVSLTYTNIPTAECLQIGQGVEGAMRQISVTGTAETVVKADGESAANPTTLGTACNSAARVSMTFTFGK